MRVAIYGRVSTSHQVDHQTIEQQLERLTAHVRAHAAEDWALNLAHVFRDDGYSGAVLARPGLDRLGTVTRTGTQSQWPGCWARSGRSGRVLPRLHRLDPEGPKRAAGRGGVEG